MFTEFVSYKLKRTFSYKGRKYLLDAVYVMGQRLRYWDCLNLKSNFLLKTMQRLFALLDLHRMTCITAVSV